MLLRFSVLNFTSINEEITLDMIPAKSRTMKEHIITDVVGKKTEVLPIACIYGANASGKSNLIKAMGYAQGLILNGTKAGKSTMFTPFLLDTVVEKEPGRFEFVFKHEGILYTYGFVVSANTIHEEWLFAYYSAQESLVFERVTKDEKTTVNPGTRFIEGAGRKKFIEYVAQGTRPNQLFLTEAGEKNIELLKPVLHWFSEHLTIVSPDSQYGALTLRAHNDKEFLEFLAKFLQVADTGITDIHTFKEVFDRQKHADDIPPEILDDILKNVSNRDTVGLSFIGNSMSMALSNEIEEGKKVLNYISLKTDHTRDDGMTIPFDLGLESDGTRRLMHLAPMLLEVQGRERVFVIDEIDRSLHTHLSRLFLEACLLGIIEKGARGQFILTTHDTNLLDRDLLRRDEIWFMEKDKHGASHLTSMAEYKVSDGLNYENGYLHGRFGAIPFIGDAKNLLR